MKKLVLIAMAVMSLSFAKLTAQELNATVIVNMEQIAPENRMFAQSMERDVQNYINNQRYTKDEWDGPKIPVDIMIVLTGGNKGSFNGRLFIASKRIINGDENAASVSLKMADADWSFDYAQGATLTYNPQRFDKFTSLLDYYMFLILGLDMDTYGELEGTAMYEAAKQIVQLGASKGVSGYATFAAPGETSRYSIVSELTDLRYEPFRRLIFSYYVDGLDVMAEKPEQAKAAVAKVIADMADFKQKKMVGPSMLLQTFFDTKAPEIASIVKGMTDKKLFENLKYLDPTNSMIYSEAEGK